VAPRDLDTLSSQLDDIRRQLKIANLALGSSLDAVIVHTTTGRVVYFNDVAAEHAGLTREEFSALPPWGFSGSFTPQQRQAMVARIVGRGSLVFHSERPRNGERRMVEVHACYAEGEPGDEPLIVSITHDVTEKLRADEILRHRAFHDSLTGLANRALFEDRLELGIAGAKRHGTILGIAYVDVDEFKHVNDRYGHGIGDRVLVVLGERLAASVRQIDTAARYGGDEFVLIFPQLTSQADLEQIVHKLSRRLGEPMSIEDLSLQVTSSIGSALFDTDTDDARSLIMRADIAMYEAKRARASERVTPQ
jgi:diguanylate cyclase (GGDEF)-like protein/PAS domain S-box-containing protein